LSTAHGRRKPRFCWLDIARWFLGTAGPAHPVPDAQDGRGAVVSGVVSR
jgi:hypothetical protein